VPAEETVIRGDLAETKTIANDSEQITLTEEATLQEPAEAEAAPAAAPADKAPAPEVKKASRKRGPSSHHKAAETPAEPGTEVPQATEPAASADAKVDPEPNQS
jgi:hypothetical protein